MSVDLALDVKRHLFVELALDSARPQLCAQAHPQAIGPTHGSSSRERLTSRLDADDHRDGGGKAAPAARLFCQALPAGRGQRVILRPPAVVAFALLRGEPALLLELVQR